MEKILKSESMPAASKEWKENVFKIQGLDFPLLKPAQRRGMGIWAREYEISLIINI